MKTCTKCGIEKELFEFNRDRSKSDGYYSSCKDCNKRTEYFAQRKEKKSEYDRKRYDKFSSEIKLSSNKRYHNNKTRYNKRSVELINKDLFKKLKAILRKRMCKIISGTLKSGSAVRDLGCSIEEFKFYIESKFYNYMTWDNYGGGIGKWQIDHIIPLHTFDLTKREEFLKACHYTNLQPLWYEDHLKKTKEDLRRNVKCVF